MNKIRIELSTKNFRKGFKIACLKCFLAEIVTIGWRFLHFTNYKIS